MRITKNSTPLEVGTVVVLPDEETLIIKEVCREPDGYYYRAQFVEDDGDEYIPVGDMRVIPASDLVGAEV